MASSSWNDNSGEIGEDEETEDSDSANINWNAKSSIIFLIEARKNMFEIDDNNESHFIKALRCCETIMLNKIVSNETDQIGVILYGTKIGDDNSNLKNIKTVIKLDKPNVPALKQLKHLIQLAKEDGLTEYEKEIGISNHYSLGNALWLSSSTISTMNTKFHSKIIFLFTNDWNPHKDDPKEQQLARTKAKDLYDIGISVQLFHLGTVFDFSVFYQEFLETVCPGNEDWSVSDPAKTFECLFKRVNRSTTKRFCMKKLKWDLGHGVTLGVGIYNLYRKVTVQKDWIHRTTNEPVRSVRQMFHSSTGALLLPSDIEHVLEISGEKIVFTPEEKKLLNQISEPGITLLGFKPSSSIDLKYFFQPCKLIYPDESIVKGSRMLFKTLLDRCIALDKVPVCFMSLGKDKHPNVVLLQPHLETSDESENQTSSGFYAFYLSYSDFLRDIPLETSPTVSNSQVDIAKQVIRKLRLNFSPKNFENPKLQTHWANVEALALEYDKAREIHDDTVPDLEEMKRRLGSLSLSFINAVYPLGYNPEQGTKVSNKRSTQSSETNRSKVTKRGPSDIQQLVNEKKVDLLTVKDLKECLAKFSVKTTGKKKSDLVELVYRYYEPE